MNSSSRAATWVAVALVFFGVHAYLTPHCPAPMTAELVAAAAQSEPLGSSRERESAAPAPTAETLHLDLTVRLEPSAHTIEATARVLLPAAASGEVRFLLHRDLNPRSASPGVSLESDLLGSVTAGAVLSSYRVRMPPGQNSFEIRYGGEIYHPLEEYGQDYARSFGWTPGVIGAEYVYLTRGSGWYPVFGDELLSFRLDLQAPPGWTAVSQGDWSERGEAGGRARVVWNETHPQNQIYLLAAPFQVYERPVGTVDAQVFLRSPDPGLAGRYLEATEQYLGMYQELLGPYPYGKFALVENFWETGYGMPSFTLLGPRVIRLPFIPTSSYPHEILHNWWGNGVYVDYPSGNWSEGLTAYLSDHLIQEQRGKGAEHRQSSLQKYLDYVGSDRDFALTEFRSRHGSATQAVGYTKMMMLAHMLRMSLGQEVFVTALRNFYRDYRFRSAAFADLEAAFSAAAGRSQADFFRQWVEREGAPELVLAEADAVPRGSAHVLRLDLRQAQDGEPYPLLVPLAVTLEGRETAEQISVFMQGRRLEWEWTLPARPLRVDVDPEFDLMRRLHPQEIPPALSGVFGAAKLAVVLPSAASQEARAAYRELAQSWLASGNVELEMLWDEQLAELPGDRAVWVFGWENRLLDRLAPALAPYGAALSPSGAELPGLSLRREGNAVALGVRHPAAPQWGVAVFAADRSASIPALGRRLPHFHKYSYLAFEGERAANTLRGRWPVVDSPLTAWPDEAETGRIPPARLKPREPLAPAPPIVLQAAR